MLRGRFGDTSGRPFMEGHVLLPRLGLRGNVSSIFDTGADTSLLMPLDAQRMGMDYGLLGNELSTLGIGGESENFPVELARGRRVEVQPVHVDSRAGGSSGEVVQPVERLQAPVAVDADDSRADERGIRSQAAKKSCRAEGNANQ